MEALQETQLLLSRSKTKVMNTDPKTFRLAFISKVSFMGACTGQAPCLVEGSFCCQYLKFLNNFKPGALHSQSTSGPTNYEAVHKLAGRVNYSS